MVRHVAKRPSARELAGHSEGVYGHRTCRACRIPAVEGASVSCKIVRRQGCCSAHDTARRAPHVCPEAHVLHVRAVVRSRTSARHRAARAVALARALTRQTNAARPVRSVEPLELRNAHESAHIQLRTLLKELTGTDAHRGSVPFAVAGGLVDFGRSAERRGDQRNAAHGPSTARYSTASNR